MTEWSLAAALDHWKTVFGEAEKRFIGMIEEVDKRGETRAVADAEARQLALSAMAARLELMNEFQRRMNDLVNTFATKEGQDAFSSKFEGLLREARSELLGEHKVLVARVGALERATNTASGKSQGLSLGWRIVVGGLGFILTALTIIVIVLELAQH